MTSRFALCIVVASAACGTPTKSPVVGPAGSGSSVAPPRADGPRADGPPTARHPGPCAAKIVWGSGDPPARVTYAYDAQGRVIRSEWDGDGDGVVTSTTRYEYREPGRVHATSRNDANRETREELSDDGNLALIANECVSPSLGIECRYDAHGNLTEIEWSALGGQIDHLLYDYACWR